MQIRLIVPAEEEDRERSKGTSSEPAFCPFVAHGADATTGGWCWVSYCEIEFPCTCVY